MRNQLKGLERRRSSADAHRVPAALALYEGEQKRGTRVCVAGLGSHVVFATNLAVRTVGDGSGFRASRSGSPVQFCSGNCQNLTFKNCFSKSCSYFQLIKVQGQGRQPE